MPSRAGQDSGMMLPGPLSSPTSPPNPAWRDDNNKFASLFASYSLDWRQGGREGIQIALASIFEEQDETINNDSWLQALRTSFSLIPNRRSVLIHVGTDIDVGRNVGEDGIAYVFGTLQGKIFEMRRSAGDVRSSTIRSRALGQADIFSNREPRAHPSNRSRKFDLLIAGRCPQNRRRMIVTGTGEHRNLQSKSRTRHGIAQGLVQLYSAHEIWGTYLGYCMIKERFSRMIHLDDTAYPKTIVMEATAHLRTLYEDPTILPEVPASSSSIRRFLLLVDDKPMSNFLPHSLGSEIGNDIIVDDDGCDRMWSLFRNAMKLLLNHDLSCPRLNVPKWTTFSPPPRPLMCDTNNPRHVDGRGGSGGRRGRRIGATRAVQGARGARGGNSSGGRRGSVQFRAQGDGKDGETGRGQRGTAALHSSGQCGPQDFGGDCDRNPSCQILKLDNLQDSDEKTSICSPAHSGVDHMDQCFTEKCDDAESIAHPVVLEPPDAPASIEQIFAQVRKGKGTLSDDFGPSEVDLNIRLHQELERCTEALEELDHRVVLVDPETIDHMLADIDMMFQSKNEKSVGGSE